MQKKNTLLICLFLCMLTIYPAFLLPGKLLGYVVVFTLFQKLLFSVIFVLGTACCWMLFRKENIQSGTTLFGSICCVLAFLMYLVNVVLILWVGLIETAPWTVLPMLAPFPLVVLLNAIYLKPFWLKVASLVTFTLLSMVVGLALLITLFFALIPFDSSEFLRTVDSPNGDYCAYLILHDAGATGGSTNVGIYKKGNEIHLGLCDYKPSIQYLFSGSWGLQDSVTIEWTDNETILINGRQYRYDPLTAQFRMIN